MDHDRGLFVSIAGILAAFGALMVYSASITAWPSEFEQVYLSRHLVFLSLGVVVAAICALLPAELWFRTAPWFFALAVVLLVAVLIPGVGARINGARRWLRLGTLSLQPSELAKIALPLLLCRLVCSESDPRRLGRLWRLAAPVTATTAVVVLVSVEPDLGTGLFLAFGAAVALFVGRWPLRNFLLAGAVGLPACAFLVALRPYQMERLRGLAATWSDFNEAPYQLQQSLISLGSGGLTGVGLGRGWQKLSFLPEANTDFVFAVVGEELGLLGTLTLVALWAGLYAVGLRMLRPLERAGQQLESTECADDRRAPPARNAPFSTFSYVAAFTLLTQLVFQAALNMAVAVALVPPKGIPHPLISYGGSNLVTTLMSLGIVLSLSRGWRFEGPSQRH